MKVQQTQNTSTRPADLVALDQRLSGLRGAGSIAEIGAQLKALAGALPDGGVSIAELPQVAKTALRSAPASLSGTLQAAAKDGDVKVFLGSTAPHQARETAKELGLAVGASDFKVFSTGDPFTFLGRPADKDKGVTAEAEDVQGKTVYVVQGGKNGVAGVKHDLPTLVTEALQTAYAAVTNGADRAVLLLPEILDPAKHPDDKFSALVHRLAIASGVDVEDIKYVRALNPGELDGTAPADVRQGLPSLGPKTREAEQGLASLASATSMDQLEAGLKKLDLAVSGLEGKYGDAARVLAQKTADVLAERMALLVPGFGDNAVLSTGAKTVVLAGQSNPALGEDIAQSSRGAFAQSKLSFDDHGRPRADFGGSVQGKDVVIVQTTRQDPGSALEDRQSVPAMLAEALLLFQSAMEKGASDVKLVLPYMPSARSDKNDQKGVGAYAGLVARWVDAIVEDGEKLARARGKRTEFKPRVVLVEPHDPHNPVFFRTPVSVVSGAEVLMNQVLADIGRENTVLVKPDEGATKRTAGLAKSLHLPMVDGQKSRADNNEKASVDALGAKSDVDGKKCVVVDDEIATGGTMRQTCQLLKKSGATEVHVAVSHANMPVDATERHEAMRKLKDAGATSLYLLDTQPVGALPPDLEGFVHVVSAADAITVAAGKKKAVEA